MILSRKRIEDLLNEDYKKAEKEIENQFNYFRQFDKEIDNWLNTMPHFGGYGEYYEMVNLFNSKLFN